MAALSWSASGLTSPAEDARHHLRGVVDHGHDAGVVEPRRADDAEHADDLLRGVPEGGGDHRRAREREELVLGADEDAHALAALGACEELDNVGLRLEIGEEQADALEVL